MREGAVQRGREEPFVEEPFNEGGRNRSSRSRSLREGAVLQREPFFKAGRALSVKAGIPFFR